MRIGPVLLCGVVLASGGAAADELLVSPFAAPPAKEGYRYPDCYCTDSDGQRVEIGDIACLRIGRKRVLARCGMSQNSPAWRPEQDGCPISARQTPWRRAATPAIGAKVAHF